MLVVALIVSLAVLGGCKTSEMIFGTGGPQEKAGPTPPAPKQKYSASAMKPMQAGKSDKWAPVPENRDGKYTTARPDQAVLQSIIAEQRSAVSVLNERQGEATAALATLDDRVTGLEQGNAQDDSARRVAAAAKAGVAWAFGLLCVLAAALLYAAWALSKRQGQAEGTAHRDRQMTSAALVRLARHTGWNPVEPEHEEAVTEEDWARVEALYEPLLRPAPPPSPAAEGAEPLVIDLGGDEAEEEGAEPPAPRPAPPGDEI